MGSVIGSSPSPELASALHRLRSILARMRAELEVVEAGGERPTIDAVHADLRQALDMLAEVEALALGLVRVIVLDDDERLGELTARALRRVGFDAESARTVRPLRLHELVVLDLSLTEGIDASTRALLKRARPIVVTGATDPAARAAAAELDAADYLIKPVELEDLVEALKRRAGAG